MNLIKLIRINRGKVHVFPHTIEEVYGVLKSFAYSPTSSNNYSLYNLQEQKLTPELIMSKANKVADTLQDQFRIYPKSSDALSVWRFLYSVK